MDQAKVIERHYGELFVVNAYVTNDQTMFMNSVISIERK